MTFGGRLQQAIFHDAGVPELLKEIDSEVHKKLQVGDGRGKFNQYLKDLWQDIHAYLPAVARLGHLEHCTLILWHFLCIQPSSVRLYDVGSQFNKGVATYSYYPNPEGIKFQEWLRGWVRDGLISERMVAGRSIVRAVERRRRW